MIDVWYIQTWKAAVDTALLNVKNNETPIVFTDWTMKLVNAEAEYIKDNKKNSTKIPSTSGGAASEGNKGSCKWDLTIGNLYLIPSIMLIFQSLTI